MGINNPLTFGLFSEMHCNYVSLILHADINAILRAFQMHFVDQCSNIIVSIVQFCYCRNEFSL